MIIVEAEVKGQLPLVFILYVRDPESAACVSAACSPNKTSAVSKKENDMSSSRDALLASFTKSKCIQTFKNLNSGCAHWIGAREPR